MAGTKSGAHEGRAGVARPKSHEDGGWRALAGFLYQLVATAVEQVRLDPAHWVQVRLDPAHEGVKPTEKLLWVERFGEDLAVGAGRHVELVQMKYSPKEPPRAIGKTELESIVGTLESATLRAKEAGYSSFSYRLVTNRTYTEGRGVRALTDAAQAKPADSQTARDVILCALALPDPLDLNHAYDELRRYAGALGCTPGEIDSGTDAVVGRRLISSVHGRGDAITREVLVEAFTGCIGSHALTRDRIARRTTAQVDGQVDALRSHSIYPSSPVRRDCLDSISRAVCEDGRALVFLTGCGGTGKSVALYDWASRAVRHESSPVLCSTIVEYAPEASELTVPRVVGDWAGAPDGSQWAHGALSSSGEHLWEGAVQRLVHAADAGDGHRPVLVVALDALDEADDVPRWLREALRRHYEEDRLVLERLVPMPRSVLLVTVRQLEQPHDLCRILSRRPEFAVPTGELCTIDLGDFSDSEFVDAISEAHQQLDEDTRARLRSLVNRDADARGMRQLLPPGTGTELSRPSQDPQPGLSLRRPGVWRAFLDLAPRCQEAFLAGDPEAAADLGGRLLQVVLQKLPFRFPHEMWPTATTITAALEGIAAAACEAGPAYDTEREWAEVAREHGLAVGPAKVLRLEFISAGLVGDVPPGRWRWAQPYVVHYLRHSAGGGAE